MKTIKVKLETQTVEIAKLPIGKYAELLKALKEIPAKFGSMTSLDAQEVLKVLPTLLSDSLPEAIHILTIATPLTAEELNGFALDELVDICLAVYEVNNYKGIYDKIKKATAPSNPAQ